MSQGKIEPLPTHGARLAVARVGLSLFIAWHLLSMAASLTKKTPAGAWLRQATAPYERVLGAWQAWGMFGPNPPLGTSWLKVAGTTVDGQEVELPALVGEKDFDRIDWTYSRVQKVERNMFDSNKKSLRTAYGHFLCRTHTGEALVEVRIWKDRWMTATPGKRAEGATLKRHELSTVACP